MQETVEENVLMVSVVWCVSDVVKLLSLKFTQGDINYDGRPSIQFILCQPSAYLK